MGEGENVGIRKGGEFELFFRFIREKRHYEVENITMQLYQKYIAQM